MRINRTLVVGVALAVLVAVGWQSDAGAFFPFGGFDQYTKLRYAKWSWGTLNDENNDRDISGPNEGVELVFEGGPLGWTDPEVDILEQSFQVWQDVPTSYMGFQFVGVNEDPLYLGMPAGSMAGDLINYVAIQWPEDPIQVPEANFPALGVTIFTIITDDAYVDYGGVMSWPVTGGQILEADIIINGPAHRAVEAGQEPLADLLGTMVHEIGHFVGLGHTPLNNLELVTGGENVIPLLESPAIMISDATGVPQWVGATPTMFPIYFGVDDGQGGYKAGQADLAPDDIAGLSFMYPRGSQSNFFTISENARTQTRDGFPSIPLGGGHIVAWCNTDNSEYTRRIPLISAMTGLYEYYAANIGRFFLYGLMKNIEGGYGQLPFQATYTITCSPLNGYSFERQAPPDTDLAEFDSIEGGADTYLDPVWPSEVFHETGNLLGVEKYEVGTVLAFDSQRNNVVSLRTGKTLDTMLAGGRPMFGDQNKVCPLNVTTAGLASQATNQKLRALRDNVLLRSAWGTLLVDAYYRLSPSMARYLAGHPVAYAGGRSLMRSANWVVMHSEILLACWAALVAVVLWRRRRRVAVAGMLVGLMLLLGTPAQALIAQVSDLEMDSLSDDVVVGKVTAVETVEQQVPGLKYLVTNVTIETTDTIKAVVNKNSSLALRVPGGRKGAIVTSSPDFPQFSVGQNVVLYVKFNSSTSTYSVVGGNRGTYRVYTDSGGKQYVLASSVEAAAALKSVAEAVGAKTGEEKAGDGQQAGSVKVPLDAYKTYLRDIANQQKKK
ncbi:MAG TPA: CFI-box-CTERM domain-containing protein [Candidatus Bathyarchaeia archaeon]|nr:CFI-box-CTERM domain-containing protein [Candidatus Bathyarchaeia archaeon]